MKIDGAGCSSTVHGIKYTRVCGKVVGYQDKTTDAFNSHFSSPERRTNTIDGNYVNSVSITHGYHPRKHVWTFVAAHSESSTYPQEHVPAHIIIKSHNRCCDLFRAL